MKKSILLTTVGTALLMSKEDKDFKSTTVASGKTGDGHAYIINDYRHGADPNAANSQYERVGYVQLPGAVAYIVFTVPSEALHKKYASAVEETVKSFSYQPKYINYGAKKATPK